MKSEGGPEIEFMFTHIKTYKLFTDRAKLPFATLDFNQIYEIEESDAYIKHTVEIKGLLAPLFSIIMGRKLKRHLVIAMKELSSQAKEIKA